jgi:hypothetical protein
MSLPPSHQDWIVFQCSACSKPLKVQKVAALVSMLQCPHCGTAVRSPHASGKSEEFGPSALPEKTAPQEPSRFILPPREAPTMQGGPMVPSPRPADESLRTTPGTHPEFSGAPEAEEEMEEEEELDGESTGAEYDDQGTPLPERRRRIERRRVKIKKRRKPPPKVLPKTLTDWDQADLDNIPEAEITADIWLQAQPIPEDVRPAAAEREFIVESVDEGDGQTRTTKKRIRRRRLLLGARLIFKRVIAMSRVMGIGLALLVAGVAVYGVHVFRQKYQAAPVPDSSETTIDRSVLTSYDEREADQAVRKFLAADGIEAKLAYVRQPGRIRPLMQQWYQNGRSAGPQQAGETMDRGKRVGNSPQGDYYVILAMPVYVPDPLTPGGFVEEPTFFSVEEIRNGPTSTYLVDWETSSGYQPMHLEAYKATMPTQPYAFRVYMKEDTYYNHGFTEQDWQCVALYYPGRDFHLYGYIKKVSPEGRKLLEVVEGGGKAGIIAELAYPPDAVSREQVIVERLVHPSWFFSTAEEAATALRLPQ